MSEVTAQPTPAADPTTNLDAPATPAPGEQQRPEGETPEGEQPQQPNAPAEGQPEGEGGEEDIEGLAPEQRKSRWQRLKDARQRDRERADRAERELADVRSQQANRAPTTEDAIKAEVARRVGPEPEAKDFPDIFAHERAQREWDVRRVLAENEVKGEARSAEASREAAVRHIVRDHNERVEAFRSEVSDYDQVIAAEGAKLDIAPALEMPILESSDSARLIYHLCKNPALVRELNALPPSQALRRLGQIEGGLSRPQRKTTTTAPAPITPPKGGAGQKVTPETADDMDSYAAARRAQGYGKPKG